MLCEDVVVAAESLLGGVDGDDWEGCQGEELVLHDDVVLLGFCVVDWWEVWADGGRRRQGRGFLL